MKIEFDKEDSKIRREGHKALSYRRAGPWIKIDCHRNIHERGYMQFKGFKAAESWLKANPSAL